MGEREGEQIYYQSNGERERGREGEREKDFAILMSIKTSREACLWISLMHSVEDQLL